MLSRAICGEASLICTDWVKISCHLDLIAKACLQWPTKLRHQEMALRSPRCWESTISFLVHCLLDKSWNWRSVRIPTHDSGSNETVHCGSRFFRLINRTSLNLGYRRQVPFPEVGSPEIRKTIPEWRRTKAASAAPRAAPFLSLTRQVLGSLRIKSIYLHKNLS